MLKILSLDARQDVRVDEAAAAADCDGDRVRWRCGCCGGEDKSVPKEAPKFEGVDGVGERMVCERVIPPPLAKSDEARKELEDR
jgi:hypothetical protein